MRRLLDLGEDVFTIGLAAAVAIIVVGRALDSALLAPIYRIPLAGDVALGVRNLWQQVYDPTSK